MRTWMLALLILLLAACGGSDSDSDNDQNSSPVADTSTQADTTSDRPTAFPTFAFSQPTEAPQVQTAAARSVTETAEANTGALDPVAVERGLGRYEALACNTCHGEGGIGGDDGPSLVGYAVPEAEFIDFMRTGGELGNDHRFPAEALSPSGIANLYQYLLSLSEG